MWILSSGGPAANGVEVLWNPVHRQLKTQEGEAPAEPPNSGPRCEQLPAFYGAAGIAAALATGMRLSRRFALPAPPPARKSTRLGPGLQEVKNRMERHRMFSSPVLWTGLPSSLFVSLKLCVLCALCVSTKCRCVATFPDPCLALPVAGR